jgi:TolB-like protein/DNA-binding winged helix-turn-helix (wHTH) protein/Tfp pilus assembly protein PilF
MLRFGPFELNLTSGELRKSGLTLRLRPQAARILALLVTRPGEIIRRDQLREEIWGRDVFVDYEHGLNLCIREIRAALDDDADKPRYIETLPRIGYRFLAHVEEVASQLDPTSSAELKNGVLELNPHANQTAELQKKRTWGRLALPGGIVLMVLALTTPFAIQGLRERLLHRISSAPIESIAVLPLENLSGDPEQQYFSDGMTDELITELAKIHSLRVISRNSIMRYKGKSMPLPEIARELNVDAIVEGTVMRSGNQVRITAQLIAAPQDRHLWAEKYEGDLHDVLRLQDDVARDIATQVKAGLSSGERVQLAQMHTVNPQAYELLLRGRYEWDKRTKESLMKGLEYFQQSARLDPNFAPAYVGIAESYGMLGNNYFMPPNDVYPQAKAAALKALELDPDLSEAHTALAEVINDYEWNWAEGEKEYKRAIELDANNANAHHWYAMSLSWVGRADESIKEIELARQLDPVSVRINTNVGIILLFARQYDRAAAEAKKTLEFEPNDSQSRFVLGIVNLKKGSTQLAVQEFKQVADAAPQGPLVQAWLAYGYAITGEKQRALSLLEVMKERSRVAYYPPAAVAYVYGALGNKDEAFAWLDKAIAAHDGPLRGIMVNPVFDPLRSDPRFAEVLRRRDLAQ